MGSITPEGLSAAAGLFVRIAQETVYNGGVVRWVLTELQPASGEVERAVMETIVPPMAWLQLEPMGEGSWERERLYPRRLFEEHYPEIMGRFDDSARFLCGWNGDEGPRSMAVDLATTEEAVALWWHQHFRNAAEYPPADLRTRQEMMAGSEHHARAMLSWDRGEHSEQLARRGMAIAEQILSTPERN